MPEPSLAERAVARYLELINARRYDEVGSIYAEDAVFLAPTGEEIRGRTAITEFYRGGLEKIRPSRVRASSSVAQGNQCVIEITATGISGSAVEEEHTVVDHFTVNDAGEVTRMAVYLRPAELAQTRVVLGLDDA